MKFIIKSNFFFFFASEQTHMIYSSRSNLKFNTMKTYIAIKMANIMNVCERANLVKQNGQWCQNKIILCVTPSFSASITRDGIWEIVEEALVPSDFSFGLMHPCYHTYIREMNIDCGLIHNKYFYCRHKFYAG